MVNLLKSYFKDKPFLLVYLFGSFAKGLENFDSDVDIAILSREEINLYDYQQELIQLLGREVDLINIAKTNIILKQQIAITGIPLLGTPEAINSFKYNTIVEYAQYNDDLLPVKNKIRENGYILGKGRV